MNLKEFIRLTYGLFMGTSTPFLKPNERYLFPTQTLDVDSRFSLFLGGSAVCGLLVGDTEAVLINSNQLGPSRRLREWVQERTSGKKLTVLLNSAESDFAGGLGSFDFAQRVITTEAGRSHLRTQLRGTASELADRIEVVTSETKLQLAGEQIYVLPLGRQATSSDVAVFFESRATLFTGALFYHRLHPILHSELGLDVAAWLKTLQGLLDRFQPKTVIPAEGDSASPANVQVFMSYLRDLADPRVEFSTCRQRYDWPEIPSATSLEENFDLLRNHKKSHTTIT